MKKRIPIVLILILFAFSDLKSQSFLVKKNDSLIKSSKITVRNNFLILNDDVNLKIPIDSISKYYQDKENALYVNKGGFKEEVIIGEIKVYRGEIYGSGPYPYGGPTIGNMSGTFTDWYLEKDGLFFKAFTETDGSSKIFNLDKEKIKSLIDDTKSKEAISSLTKKARLSDILEIIQSYNAKSISNRFINNKQIRADNTSKIVIFRDFRKEIKEVLEFTINGQKHSLERNSKLEMLVGYDSESILCISNSTNFACGVIKSSPNYPKYYQLKFDKNKRGSITKVNGHSSYFKTRIDYYDKRSKK